MPFKFYNVAFILIGINVGVYILTMIQPDLLNYLAMTPAAVVVLKWWWQVATYMFTHSLTSLWHILFNMLGLLFFGVQVERRIGSNEFLLFYLLSGVIAGVFSLAVYWFTGAQFVSLVGASGAIFAVLLAFATYFPRANILLFGIFPVRAPILVIGYAALETFNMISRTRGNVAHLTHLAGFGIAFLYLVVRLRINPIREFMDSRR